MSKVSRLTPSSRRSAQNGDSGTFAVLYAAKSTKDPRGSIPTQLGDGRRLAARERWTVVAEYDDEAASAYKGNRGDGLAAAKEHVERLAAEGTDTVLVVQHADRLARGDGVTAKHLVEIALWARQVGARITSVQDPMTFEGGLAFAAMMGDRNYEDSRRKALAVTDGLRRAFERGEHGGGPAQDGYARVHGDVVEDPTRAPLLRRIFQLAADGVADANIARLLNREGHRTQKGGAWKRRRIQDTVTNPYYAGYVVWHRGKPDEERRDGLHPALVDREVFAKIQGLRAARDRAAGSNRTPGRPNTRHVLAGLAVCGRCGARMRPVTSTYKRVDGSKARKYLCEHYADSDGLCDQEPIDAEVVDAAFVQHLDSFFVDFDAWIGTVTSQRSADRAAVERNIAAERDRLAEVRRRAGTLADRFGKFVANGDDVQARACAVALERAETEASQGTHRLDELNETLTSMEAAEAAPIDAMLDLYNHLADAVRGRISRDEVADVNRGLREVLDRVLLDGARLESGAVVQVLPQLRAEAVAFLGGEYAEPILLEGAPGPIVPPLHRLEAHPERNVPNAQAEGPYVSGRPRPDANALNPYEPWHFGYTLNAGTTSVGFGGGRDGGSAMPSFVPAQYAPMLAAAAQRWNVSAALLAAQLYAESNFNPNVVSSAGAQGIAQFMPGTAQAYGLDNPFDPASAIDAQARMMRDLLRQFGTVPLALAAYNAGPGAVQRYGGIPPYSETQAYVAKILGLLRGAGDTAGLAAAYEVRLVR